MPDRPAASRPRGLTAVELGYALDELAEELLPAKVLDAVALLGTGGNDDLLLVVAPESDGKSIDGQGVRKRFLHVALGGTRARISTTAHRFGRERRARGPGPDLVARELGDARLTVIEAADGERRFALHFETASGRRSLFVELFGARGFWALCDQNGTCLAMSRAIETAVRRLGRGDVYAPPPPMPPPPPQPKPTTTAPQKTTTAVADPARTSSPKRDRGTPPPPRFSPPGTLVAIDAHFDALDATAEQGAALAELQLAAERARKKASNKANGLQRQLDDVGRTDELRTRADLMLAYAHQAKRGDSEMRVPALDGSGEVALPLDPKKPVAIQANQLYDKARRLEQGRRVTEERLAQATGLRDELSKLAARLAEPGSATAGEDAQPHSQPEGLDAIRRSLIRLGALPKDRPPTRKEPNKGGRRSRDAGVPYRRFESAEGYPIFIGRNNTQNDELTMRFAKGNDLWMHVGGGRPGSHVVIRLPKLKTASLETLLDAATLAVHFSKARGESRIDVIYTFKKHVKKPKGLPPGAVVPAHTKTITVQREEERLRRLLDSAGESAS